MSKRGAYNIAIKQPEGLEVEKFFPPERELEKLRNTREFKIKDFEFGNFTSRVKFCLNPVQRPER